MKMRIIDRVASCVAAILLLLAAALMAAQVFFNVPVCTYAEKLLQMKSWPMLMIPVSVGLVVIITAILCLFTAFRRKGMKGFVEQQADGGELSISMSAIESLVMKNAGVHPEAKLHGIKIANTRDGLVIRLTADVVSNVSIPFFVNEVQKQVKHYITTCTGLDVNEVQVQVEKIVEEKVVSQFNLVETDSNDDTQVSAALTDDKALHQRLFSADEQMTDIPLPAELVEPADKQTADSLESDQFDDEKSEEQESGQTDNAAETVPQDEIETDAVLNSTSVQTTGDTDLVEKEDESNA